MKKILACIACVVMAATMSLSAMAAGLDANKQKIVDAVNQSITVNGKVVSLPADDKTQVENYLKRDDVTITADQATTVVAQINKAIDVVKTSGVDSLDKLSGSDKSKILDIANTAAAAVDLKISVNSANNTIKILDKNNTVVATLEPVIKTTGSDASSAVAAIGFVLVLLAGCAVVARKSKLAAK